MICTACGSYYKATRISSTKYCFDCEEHNYDIMDEEMEVELNKLLNPTGRVRAKIEDDREDSI